MRAQVMNYASIVPSIIIPSILGIVFNAFADRDEAYKVRTRLKIDAAYDVPIPCISFSMFNDADRDEAYKVTIVSSTQ